MKQLFTFITAILLTTVAFAQAPEMMSYQAVVRNANNTLVANQTIGMQISILKGSPSGSAVFVETQTPLSNTNGLISLEIGTGNLVSGNFATVDWGSDTYFLKTEIDPTGGNNYSITGTTQFMSVPYALHAKTADNVVNDMVDDADADPGNELQTLIVSQTGDTLTISGGNSVLVPGISGLNFPVLPAIGDYRDGGVVFWVDGNGGGLVCAVSDQSNGIIWHNGTNLVTGATATAIGTGMQNTVTIVGVQGAGSYAAESCSSLTLNGYSDWFLPSQDELNEIYLNLGTVNAAAITNGGTAFNLSNGYWTSSEYNATVAYTQNLSNGYQGLATKNNLTYQVRAIRAF